MRLVYSVLKLDLFFVGNVISLNGGLVENYKEVNEVVFIKI